MSRALVLLALLLVGCSVPLDPPPPGDAEGGGPPRPGGVLRLGMAEDPRTLDPAKGYDVVSWSFEAMLFDTLVDYDDGTAIVPKLAASWTVSEDGRHWRFQLRPGVRFSSGRPLGAEDVRYSLERTLRPSLRSPGAEFLSGITGAEAYLGGRAAAVAGLRTPAPDVLEIDAGRTPIRCSCTSWRCPSRRWSIARRPSATATRPSSAIPSAAARFASWSGPMASASVSSGTRTPGGTDGRISTAST